MLRRLIVVTALALAAGPGQSGAAGGTPVAFVSTEDASQLVGVDLRAQRVVARIPVARGPHNVAAWGRSVLVTSPPAGRVTLVDALTKRVRHVFGGFGYPHDVEFDPVRRYAYVTDERRGELVVLDLRKLRVARRVAVGAGAHDLAVSPDGSRVWVTHGPSGTALRIVDTSRPAGARVVGSVPTPGAHDLEFSPDGLYVWVTYWNSAVVGKFEAIAERLGVQKRVGTLIHHVQMGLRDEVWLTDHEAGRAYAVSGRTGNVVRTLSGCAGAHHVAVGGGLSVVVACHDSGALALYDQRTWRRTLVRVGAGPHGVAVTVLP